MAIAPLLTALLLTSSAVLCPLQAARVLLVPTQLNSHVFEMVEAVRDLPARGHHVYMTLGHTFSRMSRVQNMGITPLVYTQRDTREVEDVLGDLWNEGMTLESASNASRWLLNCCESMVDNAQFMNTLRELQFDIAVASGFPLCKCSMLIPRVLGVPFVHMFSAGNPWELGIPALPSTTPIGAVALERFQFTDKMTFQERIINLLLYVGFVNYKPFEGYWNTSLLHRFAPEYTSWNSLNKDAELFIITRDHLLEFPAPTLPNVIYTPGITVNPAKPLPEDFEKLVQAQKGFILVSFGSIANNIPKHLVTRLVKVFNLLDDTVIWKLTGINKNAYKMGDNIHVFDWIPQNDLLGHPLLKMFITHCGNNGQYEAVYHGVPMVGLPLAAEQAHNSFRMAAHGYGINIKAGVRGFTVKELIAAIGEIKSNPSYKQNIFRASQILKDSPMTPSETVAYWLEHVIKFGTGHLRSHGSKMPLYKVFMLDILALVLVIGSILLYVVRILLVKICRCFQFRKIKAE